MSTLELIRREGGALREGLKDGVVRGCDALGAHVPIPEGAAICWASAQDFGIAVPGVIADTSIGVEDRLGRAFQRLNKEATMNQQHTGDVARSVVAYRGPNDVANEIVEVRLCDVVAATIDQAVKSVGHVDLHALGPTLPMKF